MGFTKWLLINGPGSPGSTTRHLINLFMDAISSTNNLTISDSYQAIYSHRSKNAIILKNSGALFSIFNSEFIYDFIENDFSLFAFIIMYLETKQFRKTISLSLENRKIVLEVIRNEVIKANHEILVSLPFAAYEEKAFEFIKELTFRLPFDYSKF